MDTKNLIPDHALTRSQLCEVLARMIRWSLEQEGGDPRESTKESRAETDRLLVEGAAR
jgi:hypothetical protein